MFVPMENWRRSAATSRIVGGWHHVVGVLSEDKSMKLYVDGELVGEGKSKGLIAKDPAQAMEIGHRCTNGGRQLQRDAAFTGLIDEVRLYFLAADAATDRQTI